MVNKEIFIFQIGVILLLLFGIVSSFELEEGENKIIDISQSNNDFQELNNPKNAIEGDKLWSEKQLCNFLRGCLEEKYCYPLGYRQNETYCGVYYYSKSISSTKFLSQLENNEFCINNFECKSNLCLDKKCLDILNYSSFFQEKERISDNSTEIIKEHPKDISIENNSTEEKYLEENSQKRGFWKALLIWKL